MRHRLILILSLFILSMACNQYSDGIYQSSYPNLISGERNLAELKSNQFNIFIAFANDCPVCKSSIPTLRVINKDYPNVGIVLFYPNNPLDSSINKFINGLLPMEIVKVKDKNKRLTKFFNAEVTPQAFVVDSVGTVIYKGAIDNSVFTNYRKNYNPKESFLINALDTLVNLNLTLKQNETKAVGCYIE